MNKNEQIKSLPLPPGQVGLPFLGEFLSLFNDGNEFAKKRHQKYGEIFKTNLLGKKIISVAGAESVRFFLTNKHIEVNLFPAMKKLLGTSLPNQTGQIQKSRRQIIAQSFKNRALESYFDKMVEITHDYLHKWQVKGQLTWYPELQDYSFDVGCDFLIGLDHASQTSLRHLYETWTNGLFSFFPFRLPWTKFGRAYSSREKILARIEKIIKQRQQEAEISSDALSILLQAKDEKGEHLSIEELKDQVLNLLFAGHSTLTSALASFCRLVAEHPDVLAKAREEQKTLSNPITKEQLDQMPYLEQVIKEVLRLNPPVGGGFRRVLEDCEFKGYRIPKGWNLIYSINETHQDLKVYSEPEKFNPDRFSSNHQNQPFSYIPFGGGMRECLGKELAKLEMKVFTALLLRNYKWSLIPDQDLELELIPVPRPKDGLKVEFSAYH